MLQDPSHWNEGQWSAHIANEIDGVTEYVCIDGSRCDILTEKSAYEVEWSSKWKEAPAQAVLYGALTNRDPVVLLLVRNREKEKRYILRCAIVCSQIGIRLETRKIP